MEMFVKREFSEIYDYAIERKKDCPEEFHLEACLYFLPFKYAEPHLKGRFSERPWDRGVKPYNKEILSLEIKHRINECSRILSLKKYPAVRRLIYNIEMFAFMAGLDKDLIGPLDLKPESLQLALNKIENTPGLFSASK